MKRINLLFLLLFCCGSLLKAATQFDPEGVCRLENGKLIFVLNPHWTSGQQREIADRYDLDTLLLKKLLNSGSPLPSKSGEWSVRYLKNGQIEISKSFGKENASWNPKSDQLPLLLDKWMNFKGAVQTEEADWGVNNFKIGYTFQYGKDAWIFLPGYKLANKVFISGSFNEWSTTQHPMQRNDSGWSIHLPLAPGKYRYKFIVDGSWMPDPSNNLKERDGAGGYNSVLYCPNYLFSLKGNLQAREVVLTGDFFRWNPKGIRMEKREEGWFLPAYLKDGYYLYKFIADGQWMTDPANPEVRPDGSGHQNSLLAIGTPYLFRLNGVQEVAIVYLAGSFNNWKPFDIRMKRVTGGWETSYILPPGNYEYKFIAEKKWMTDPENPFTLGKEPYENSFLALKANHLFELKGYDQAANVILSGSFNGWSKDQYRMKKVGGRWIFPLYLRPGKYTYKFIVDGKWITDPDNTLYEPNEAGTDNSILWINP